MNYVKTDEGRAMWNVMLTMAEVGRPVTAPPGVPPELTKILRTAFEGTMKDPDFIAEMNQTGRELSPESGEEMERKLEEVSQVPSKTLSKLIDYTRRSETGGQ
jgi:tripartite-type tricarboxylate transporter receptor subunit TctC